MKVLFIYIIAFIIIAWIWLLSVWDNIKIKIDLAGIDFSKALSGNLPVTATIKVTNNNSFNIRFSSLKITLYKDGKLIGNSSYLNPSNSLSGMIPGRGGYYQFTHVINLYPGIISIAQKFSFDYHVSLRIFGIPFTVKNTYTHEG